MPNRICRGSHCSILFVLVLLGLTRVGQAQDRFNMSHSALTGSQAILFVTRDAGIFRKYNLEPQIIYITGAPPNISALLAGSVDFVVFAGPAAITANLAGANTAALADLGLDYLGTSLVTSRAVIDKKIELVRRMVTAFAEGIHFYKTNKPASLRSIARLMKIDDAEAIEESYNAYAIKFMARGPYANPS